MSTLDLVPVVDELPSDRSIAIPWVWTFSCVCSKSRVSNRKYESMQNQFTAVFPGRSTIGKIETIPQMGMTLKMFVPNAILN